MAIVKTLIVKGVARFLTDAYMSTIRSGIWNGSTIQVGYGGTGVTSAKGNLYTPVFLASNGITPCSVEIPHNTKAFKINGTTYSIFTTYTGTAPTIFAPTTLAGTGGYILATNSAKTGLEWVAANSHTHSQYVLLDSGTNEQVIKSSISSLGDGVISLWRATGGGYPMIGFANGTTKTHLGKLGFSAANKPIFRNTSNTDYLLAHAGNISNKAATIGTSLTTIATIAGVDITAKIGSYAASSHTHKIKTHGTEYTIAAPGGDAVDIGNYVKTVGDEMTGALIFKIPNSGSDTSLGGTHAEIFALDYAHGIIIRGTMGAGGLLSSLVDISSANIMEFIEYSGIFNFRRNPGSGTTTIVTSIHPDGTHSKFHHMNHDNDDSVLLAGGGYKALSDFLLSSIAAQAEQLAQVTKSLAVNTWTDMAAINTYTGTYAIQISSGNVYASGVFTACGGTDTVIDEIPLHVADKGTNTWRPYARISAGQLQMTTNEATGTARTYTIKILKLI